MCLDKHIRMAVIFLDENGVRYHFYPLETKELDDLGPATLAHQYKDRFREHHTIRKISFG